VIRLLAKSAYNYFNLGSNKRKISRRDSKYRQIGTCEIHNITLGHEVCNMKVKELPKAPIQIQRDELLAKVAELKRTSRKSHTIITLQAELNSKSEVITNKDNTIANLQAELNVKTGKFSAER
jgi:hypothetical protein